MELKYKAGVAPTAAQLKEINKIIMREPAEGWGFDNEKGCQELVQHIELEGFKGTYLYTICIPLETVTILCVK